MTSTSSNSVREIALQLPRSNGFILPDGACLGYRALYDGLREFEQEPHRHVPLENNILFPRAIELEAKACGGAPV
jgi:regulator of cell morphogenesis and NO signaling